LLCKSLVGDTEIGGACFFFFAGLDYEEIITFEKQKVKRNSTQKSNDTTKNT